MGDGSVALNPRFGRPCISCGGDDIVSSPQLDVNQRTANFRSGSCFALLTLSELRPETVAVSCHSFGMAQNTRYEVELIRRSRWSRETKPDETSAWSFMHAISGLISPSTAGRTCSGRISGMTIGRPSYSQHVLLRASISENTVKAFQPE